MVQKWTEETIISELKRLSSENDNLSLWDIRTGFGRTKATGLYKAMDYRYNSVKEAIEASGLNYRELIKNSQRHRIAQVRIWTKKTVIAEIKRLSEGRKDLTMWDIRTDFGRVKRATGFFRAMSNLFGSPREAIEASGLNYTELLENANRRQGNKKRTWTREKVIAELKELDRDHKDLAMWDIKTDFGRVTGTQLYSCMKPLFGSTENAIKASGLDYQLLLKNAKRRNSKNRTVWTQEKITQELKKMHREHKDLSLTDIMTDFERVRTTYLYQHMRKKFGSIRKAIESCGLDYEELYENGLRRRVEKSRRWSPEKIKNELQRLFKENENLSLRDIRTDFGKTKETSLFRAMKYHFGSISMVIESSGLNLKESEKKKLNRPYKRKRKWTKAKVIKELNELAEEHEHISMLELRTNFSKEKGSSLYSAMREHFGTVKDAIDQSKLDYEQLIANSEKNRIEKVRIWSKERVISELQTLDERYENLSMWDIQTDFGRKETSELYAAMRRYFGNVREAIIQSGLDHDGLKRHSEHIEIGEKKNWSKKKVIAELKRLYRTNERLSLKDIRTDFGRTYSASALYGAMSRYFGNPRRAIEKSGLDYDELRNNRKRLDIHFPPSIPPPTDEKMPSEKKKLFNESRCRIFNYVMENPGKHFSEIARQLGLSKRGLGYHLENMIEEGIIITKSKGVFKFYYPLGFEGEPRKLSPIQEEVFETLQEGPLTSEDLAKTLDRSKASVEYHLRNLMNMGFVERQMVGRKYEWYV